MRKTTVAFMVLLALLLAVPWLSHAGHGHHGHHRYHGHHGHPRVIIGGRFWFGPPPYWRPAAWHPRSIYLTPVYCCPPSAYVQQPQAYAQGGPAEPEYWYYCDNPQGFYPYIKSCPGGWMRVVPETVPPNR